jgi:hypothetical protein
MHAEDFLANPDEIANAKIIRVAEKDLPRDRKHHADLFDLPPPEAQTRNRWGYPSIDIQFNQGVSQ